MPSRRDLLASLLAAPAALTLNRTALAQGSPLQAALAAVSDGQAISRDALLAFAREVSRNPYQAPRADVPRSLQQLSLDQYRQIRMKPDQRVWAGENRGFTLDLLPAGNVFTTPVTIRTVDGGIIRDKRFQADQYDYGQTAPLPTEIQVPYTGFRAYAGLNSGTPADEALVFQGASLFRALARGQVYGVMARGLTLNVAEAQGEEFPSFRSFWIERPGPGGTSLVVHALLDSDSVTGLYRFSLRPGDSTVCDVEVTLFPRNDLQHVGIAPMTANYLFAPNDRANVDDVRGGVHDTQGLQIWNGNGEWIWRPVTNPETLQVSGFVDQNPRGFGLLQRDRRLRPSTTSMPVSSVGRACGSNRWAIGARARCSWSRSRSTTSSTATSSPIGALGRRWRGAASTCSPTGCTGAGRRPSARRAPWWWQLGPVAPRAADGGVASSWTSPPRTLAIAKIGGPARQSHQPAGPRRQYRR